MLQVPVTPSDHSLGAADALVTLVEYGDYECPHCALAHPVTRLLVRHFGADLRFVFRHFPLSEVHPMATPAAEAAEFAGDHGRFWQMHDGIYENQERLSLAMLLALADHLGLSSDDLREALREQRHREKVQADFLGGVRSGVNGTPCFFINGLRHAGGYDFTELAAAIQTAGASAGAAAAAPP